MRILVFSVSHGDVSVCSSVIKKIQGTDMIIHAGDHSSDAESLKRMFPDLEVKYVRGNCDYTAAPNDLLFETSGKKFFLSHGHKYNVKYDYGYKLFKEHALSENADIAVFGHTRNPYCNNDGNIVLLNPGSIKYGRTFGIIEIEEGKLRADICDAGLWN